MKKYIFTLSLIILLFINGFSKTWTISNQGLTFTPASLTVDIGDSVRFTIGSSHDVVEVSKEMWEAGENSPLAGGFQLPFGGGLLLPEQLQAGLHYYVCAPHAAMQMKGTILVLAPNGIPSNSIQPVSLYPNPATESIALRTTIDLTGSAFYILDITGKQVVQGILAQDMKISIHTLAQGVYFLQTGLQRKEILRFIKN